MNVLLRILLGFFLAVVAATLVMLGPNFFIDLVAAGSSELARNDFGLVSKYATFILYLTAVPALIAILVAEYFSLRSFLLHAATGGVFGFFLSGILGRFSPLLNPMGVPEQISENIAQIVLAGIAGALVYWYVAGRFAGNWRGTSGRAVEKI